MATATTTKSDDKVMAAIATIPVVGLIMFYAMKDASPLVKNYAKQSNAVLAIGVISIVASFILGMIPIINFFAIFLTPILGLLEFAAWVMLLVNALNEKMYKLPVIGDFFDGLLK